MAAAGTPTLDSLSDDVLGAIFLLLPPKDRCSFHGSGRISRRTVKMAGLVPRVCRRWHRITSHPSMWPTLDIKPQDSSMFAWLRQRSPGFRHLTLHFRHPTFNMTSALAAVAPSATQLQQLRLLTEDALMTAQLLDVAELGCISHLRGLTSLQVAFIDRQFEPTSLDNMLACLTALQGVSLEFRELSEPVPDPSIPQDAFPCSLLRCTRLTSLDFNASYTWLPACSVPAGITALQRLQHLGLRNCVTAPLPHSLNQLTCLTSLDITQDEYDYAHQLFDNLDRQMPLPPSLRVLDATAAPMESLCQLTGLRHLGLVVIMDEITDPSRLRMLGQLTSLQLDCADWADWLVFESCTGLRALHVGELEMEELRPLRFQQLTRLQLQDSHVAASDLLIVISEMPQLEVLEVHSSTRKMFELLAFDSAALARLPKLRLVDLSGSLLWASTSDHEAVQGKGMQDYLPLRVVHHLMSLQRANPNIVWVLGSDFGQ